MADYVLTCPECVTEHSCGACGSPPNVACASALGPFWMHTPRTENAHQGDDDA